MTCVKHGVESNVVAIIMKWTGLYVIYGHVIKDIIKENVVVQVLLFGERLHDL